MTRDRSSDPPKSAAELMGELQRDSDFVREAREGAQRQEAHQESYRRAIGPVLADLASKGVWVTTLNELRTREASDYVTAMPILLRWLPHVSDSGAKEEIIRTLSLPNASPDAARPLVEEFITAKTDGLRWSAANGLAVVADDSVLNDIVRLVGDNRYGKAREMLAVALGNMRSPRAVDVLIDLIDDAHMAAHAAMALGKLRASTGRDPLRALARRHPKEWVRTEAQKAIMAINNGL